MRARLTRLRSYILLLLLSAAWPQTSTAQVTRDLSKLGGKTVAYFSLEMASPELRGQRTGGLGIIAMDLVRGEARELHPVKGQVYGVSLLYRRPWEQQITPEGEQKMHDVVLDPQDWVHQGKLQLARDPAGRPVQFEVDLAGSRQHVQVFLETLGQARVLRLFAPGVTEMLYNGDQFMRLKQELLLARAGCEALKRMGVRPDVLHLNESHTAFVAVQAKGDEYFRRSAIVSTTHTPVEAGLERFPLDWFRHTGFDGRYLQTFQRNGALDLTQAMFSLSEVVNAVSTEHAEVMKRLYPDFARRIVANTNGADPVFWQHAAVKKLTASKLTGEGLRRELWQTKQQLKQGLIDEVRQRTGRNLRLDEPVLAFTRRVTPYKDTLPMLKDHIYRICADRAQGGLATQVVVAGVAHPRDGAGGAWVKEFNQWMKDPALKGRFVFVPNYLGPKTDLDLDRTAVQGADFWLSSPTRPPRSTESMEACGTSDRRSALNLGIQIWSPDTGGGREYVRQFDPRTRRGNGFFIEPYGPEGLFAQLKTASELFYGYTQKKDATYLHLLENVFRTMPALGIQANARRQFARTYVPALEGQEIHGVRFASPQGKVRFDQGLPIQAEVDLGAVDPRSLKVELWWGQAGKPWQATELSLQGTREGKAQFAGQLATLEPGTHRYTVRVAPRQGVNHRWAGVDHTVEVTSEGLTRDQIRSIAACRFVEQNRKLLPGVGRNDAADLVGATGGDAERLVSLLGTYARGARRGSSLNELARGLSGAGNRYRPQVWTFSDGQKSHGVELRPFEPLIIRNFTPFTVLSGHAGHDPDIEVNSAPFGEKGEHVAIIRPSQGKRWMTFTWHGATGRSFEGRDYSLRVAGRTFRPLSLEGRR
jgi:starch phosphorylase